jgi:hypothetical protein
MECSVTPAFDDDLRLFQRVEDFTVQQFVTQARIKTFDKAVLPMRAGPGIIYLSL